MWRNREAKRVERERQRFYAGRLEEEVAAALSRDQRCSAMFLGTDASREAELMHRRSVLTCSRLDGATFTLGEGQSAVGLPWLPLRQSVLPMSCTPIHGDELHRLVPEFRNQSVRLARERSAGLSLRRPVPGLQRIPGSVNAVDTEEEGETEGGADGGGSKSD